MPIRQATLQDIPAVLEIYNDAVATTTAVWNEQQVDLQNRIDWFNERCAGGFPVLVAADTADRVCGYATYGSWRAWSGYRYTVEHSIYVAADQRRRGTGRALLEALIEIARARGLHAMVGGIEATNEASIGLHESLGFTRAGRLEQVGCKFGRWLDLVFLLRRLDDRALPPE